MMSVYYKQLTANDVLKMIGNSVRQDLPNLNGTLDLYFCIDEDGFLDGSIEIYFREEDQNLVENDFN